MSRERLYWCERCEAWRQRKLTSPSAVGCPVCGTALAKDGWWILGDGFCVECGGMARMDDEGSCVHGHPASAMFDTNDAVIPPANSFIHHYGHPWTPRHVVRKAFAPEGTIHRDRETGTCTVTTWADEPRNSVASSASATTVSPDLDWIVFTAGGAVAIVSQVLLYPYLEDLAILGAAVIAGLTMMVLRAVLPRQDDV